MNLIQNLVHRNALKSVRHYRCVQWLYNLMHRKHLLYLKPLYKQFGLKRSPLTTIQFADIKQLVKEVPAEDVAKAKQKALLNNPIFLALPKVYQDEVRQWDKNGYVHLKGFFDNATIDAMAEYTESLWGSAKGKWRLGDRRVGSAFQHEGTWDFFHQQQFLDIASLLLGQEAVLLNNINFLRGDEQSLHSDSFFMATYPIGNMLGTWTALEDIDRSAGPLSYIPGSHRLPYITNEAIGNLGNAIKTGDKGDEAYIDKINTVVEENGFTPKYHLAKKGDLFLWHANLLHGGSEIFDASKTRKSLVGHFVGKQSICYHENSQRPAMRFSKPAC